MALCSFPLARKVVETCDKDPLHKSSLHRLVPQVKIYAGGVCFEFSVVFLAKETLATVR